MDALRRSLIIAPLAAWATQSAVAGDKKPLATNRRGLRRDDAWMPKLSESGKQGNR